MRPACEVADVIRGLGNDREQIGLNSHQLRTLRAIELCPHTGIGRAYIDACDGCGHISINYNSCRNIFHREKSGYKQEKPICCPARITRGVHLAAGVKPAGIAPACIGI